MGPHVFDNFQVPARRRKRTFSSMASIFLHDELGVDGTGLQSGGSQPCSDAPLDEVREVSTEPLRLRLRGRYFFLTYPRCSEETIVLWEHLSQLGATGAAIARESHADGDPHLHAAVDFGKQRKFGNASQHFDFANVHGNYQVARNWAAVLKYLEKEGNITYYGAVKRLADSDPAEIFAVARSANSWEEYLTFCIRNNIPFGYVGEVWRTVTEVRPPTIMDEHYPVGVLVPFLQYLRFDPGCPRSLCLQGPSGIGKTTWAKIHVPKPALLVSDIDDLKFFRSGYHVSIIFDDMHFAGGPDGKGAWPRTSQIHLVDRYETRSIRCRHRNAVIPGSTWRIFTCNEYPFTIDDAIARRVNLINAW